MPSGSSLTRVSKPNPNMPPDSPPPSSIDLAQLRGQKLLLVTDVPFWRQSNGSHLRILRLVDGLNQAGLEVVIWLVGPAKSHERSLSHQLVAPARVLFCETCMDRVAATFSRWSRTRARVAPSTPTSDESASQPPADPIPTFLPAAIRKRFRDVLARVQPRFLLLEYLSLASLLDELPSPDASGPLPRPKTILDAHDVLSARHRLAAEQGTASWLAISEDDELRWIDRFDIVWAIQRQDADFFRRASRPHVVVVGHSTLGQPLPPPTTHQEKCVFGIVGGQSPINHRALAWLLDEVWPAVHLKCPTAELWIGGSIATAETRAALEGTRASEDLAGVIWYGPFDQPEDFYGAIDVGINPVDLVSGLKIKSIETLGFGRPLVTRSAGAVGLEDFASIAVSIADQAAAFQRTLIALAQSPQFRKEATNAAAHVAKTWLAPERVYQAAWESIQTALGQSDTTDFK